MAGTKRKASVKQESKKQQKQDGQKAVSHDIDVPLDEGFKGDGKLQQLSQRQAPITERVSDPIRKLT